MDTKTLQFTAYDFLGYLVPGLAFFALVDMSIAFHFQHMPLSYDAMCGRYSQIKWQGAIPLALLCYYVGHMVSFLSSMTIERYARWRYGHPMRFLLEYPSVYPRFFNTGGNSGNWSKFFRFFTAIVLWPLWFWESLLLVTGILKNYIRSMGPQLVATVKEALAWLREKAGITIDPSPDYPTEFESLAINFTLESAPAHVYSLRNYVVLYGFIRSMTLLLVIAVWLLSLHVGSQFYANGASIWLLVSTFILTGMAGGVFCVISYGAYLKFWTRYNREALLGLTAVYLKEKGSHSFLS
ncbi:MAG: hypothetical protein ACK5G9_11470 [Akkermansiaceae bacterium]|jgi:hypothetical protein